MEAQAEYKTKPAGLFHALVTEPFTVWAYCPTCWERTNQAFHHEDERKEYYECDHCHNLHGIAVR